MCKDLLRQTPQQAGDRDELRELLDRPAGGVIFTTQQKFSPEQGTADYPVLSDRRNVIVIADEAHRSQYGFRAKVERKTGDISYGFAKYLRDGLPNASFIGFTGTPIEKEDVINNTPAVFGDYIDVYDISRAVADGATVPIYYESRLTRIELKKLETDLAELSDRALLGGMIQTVQEETERLKTIHFLEQCLADTTTNTITKVGNDLADTVITPKLRDRFQEEIVRLAADKVRVEIVRSGGKYGSPQYQVRLFAKPDAKVQDILSEGEKTCVALAAFLTELATATHRSALVFDDPVTSLDHRWRPQVAKRLV